MRKPSTTSKLVTAALGAFLTDVNLNESRISNSIGDILVSESLAQNSKIQHIPSLQEIDQYWNKDTIFYTMGELPIKDSVLADTQAEILKQYPNTQYTFLLIGKGANPSSFKYKNQKYGEISSRTHYFPSNDIVNMALQEKLLGNTKIATGKKHIIIWISFQRDDQGKRYIQALSSEEFAEKGISREIGFFRAGKEFLNTFKHELTTYGLQRAISVSVKNIETAYSKAVEREQIEQERTRLEEEARKNENERLLTKAKNKLSNTQGSLSKLKDKYVDFLGKEPRIGWDSTIQNLLSSSQKSIDLTHGYEAVQYLEQIEEEIQDMYQKIQEHSEIGNRITELQSDIETAKQGEYSQYAQNKYEELIATMETLQTQWDEKNIQDYREVYDDAQGLYEDYTDEIYQVRVTTEQAERRKTIIQRLAIGGGLSTALLTLLGGYGLNRRRRKSKKEFENSIHPYQQALEGAQKMLQETIIPELANINTLTLKPGATKEIGTELQRNISQLTALWIELRIHLGKINENLGVMKLFRKKPYIEGLTQIEEAEFSLEESSSSDQLTALHSIGGQELLSLLDTFENSGFFDLEDALSQITQERFNINEKLGAITKANSEYSTLCQNLGKQYQELLSQANTLQTSYFPTPDFPSIRHFEAAVNTSQKKYNAGDTIGGYNDLISIQEKIQIMSTCLNEIQRTSSEHNPSHARNILETHDYSTEWFDEHLKKTANLIESTAKSIFNLNNDNSGYEGVIQKLTKDAQQAYISLARVVSIGQSLSKIQQEVEGLVLRIDTTKTTLSGQYNIAPEKLFQEEGHKPETLLAEIKKLYDVITVSINSGDVENGEKSITGIEQRVKNISQIMAATRNGFGVYDERRSTSQSGYEEISSQIDPAIKTLKGIIENWSPAVLQVTSGGDTESDGNIENNIDEIRGNQNMSQENISSSQTLYDNGKPLTALAKLKKVNNLTFVNQHRINEINNTKNNIETINEENTKLVQEIKSAIKKLETYQNDSEITKDTLASLSSGLAFSQKYIALQNGEKRDPFSINEKLSVYLQKLLVVLGTIKKDKESKSDLDERIQSASGELQELEKKGHSAQSDNYPDSKKAIDVFKNTIPKLEGIHTEFVSEVNRPNQDWYKLHERLTKIQEHIMQASSVLHRDDINRRAAEDSINTATLKVNSARSWSSSYTVFISTNIGSTQLAEAHTHYNKGNFSQSQEFAEFAYRQANTAIENADSEERAEINRLAAIEAAREAAEAEKAREAAEAATAMSEARNNSINTGFDGDTW